MRDTVENYYDHLCPPLWHPSPDLFISCRRFVLCVARKTVSSGKARKKQCDPLMRTEASDGGTIQSFTHSLLYPYLLILIRDTVPKLKD